MNVQLLQFGEMCAAVEERHNPPHISNQSDENRFQAEIRALYRRLVDALSPFGEEGDLYGVSDFAVRPDLKDRLRVIGRAPHVRQFAITILTASFLESTYLAVLHEFVSILALEYRIWIDQDVDPGWNQTIIPYVKLSQGVL